MASLTANFEAGVNGNAVATTDPGSASAWDATSGAGTMVYDTTHVGHGSLSMKAINKLIAWNSTSMGTVTDHYGRFYFWTAGSGATDELSRVLSGGIGGTQAVLFSLLSGTTGVLRVADGSGGQVYAGSVDLRSQLVRLEFHIIHSATVGQVAIKTFLGDSTTPIDNFTSAANRNTLVNADTIRYGSLSASLTAWFDDIVANAAAFPGPAVVAAAGGLASRRSGKAGGAVLLGDFLS